MTIANSDRIDMSSEAYLKELIKRASHGKFSVNGGSQGIEFFIIRGGGEGFLDPWYSDKDANRDIRFDESTTAGEAGSTFIFDCNDLIVAFDNKGKLISSALLERPISISLSDDPVFWREITAKDTLKKAENATVGIAKLLISCDLKSAARNFSVFP